MQSVWLFVSGQIWIIQQSSCCGLPHSGLLCFRTLVVLSTAIAYMFRESRTWKQTITLLSFFSWICIKKLRSKWATQRTHRLKKRIPTLCSNKRDMSNFCVLWGNVWERRECSTKIKKSGAVGKALYESECVLNTSLCYLIYPTWWLKGTLHW